MIRRMAKRVRAFSADEAGLETVEYAIIMGLIVSGTVGFVSAIGLIVRGKFEKMLGVLEEA